MNPIEIHVWSDVACPWCFVGKRHLERAAHEGGFLLKTTWHSFELDPRPSKSETPGTTYVRRLAHKYGTSEQRAQRMVDDMASRGRDLGIEFDFRRAVPANTFDAHRLLHAARSRDDGSSYQNTLKELLLRAHFEQGRDVADLDVLATLASEVGLDPNEVAGVLHSDAFGADVRADEDEARRLGISGVPFFVVGRYAVGGAQPVDLLLEILSKAADDAAASAAVRSGDQGEACSPEGC